MHNARWMQDGVPDELVFFEARRRSLAAFPPSPAERRFERRFAPLGLSERGNSPYAAAPRELRDALRAGLERGRHALEEEATTWHAEPDLRRDEDGSITIAIQHERPERPDNWLPAPAGGFRPVLRMYQPESPVLHGEYRLPPLVRV